MNNSQINQTRNYGIDLFRIVSMLLVVMLHVVGVGGIVPNAELLSANFVIAWFFNLASYCAVNCYALISGYVGLKSKHKFSNLATLWLQVIFYSVGISLIFIIFKLGDSEYYTSMSFLKNSFFPMTFNNYWYFTSYVAMWFFIPLMNTAVENTPASKLKGILISSGIVIIPVSLLTDAFLVNGGFSVLWLSYLYLIGAYVKKSNCFQGKPPMKYLLMYFGCVLLSLAMKIILVVMGRSGGLLTSYVSPLVLFSAIALLAYFSNLKISPKFIKIIAFVSPLAFGVFLIHMHGALFATYFSKKFGFLANVSPVLLVFAVLGIVFGVFAVCILIDYLRKLLFDLLRIKKLFVFIEERGKQWMSKILAK